MASSTSILHSGIQSVVRKSSSSSHSLYLKEKAQEIIAKGSVQEEVLEKFSEQLLTYLETEVRKVADSYKGSNKKREHLWSMFHKVRVSSKLSSITFFYTKKFLKQFLKNIFTAKPRVQSNRS